MAEAITSSSQKALLMEMCAAPSLQMISCNITEKGYKVLHPLNKE